MPACRCAQLQASASRRYYHEACSRRPLVEEFINPSRCFGTDTIDLHQIRDRSALDRLEGAEMMQQCALACRADAGDFLQTGFAQVAHAARPVRTDCEAVRLVAQPL